MISGETAALLWSDRFDEEIGELAAGQEQVVRRMKDEVSVCLIEIENARCVSERPTNPDAFDLVLRVRSIRNQPPSLQRDDEALALLERALVLDPNSLYAMTYIAFYLSQAAGRGDGWENFEVMQRAERLLSQAARSRRTHQLSSTPTSCGLVRWAVTQKSSRSASGPSKCIRTEYGG